MSEATKQMLVTAQNAGLLGNWIGERIDNINLPNTERCRLSAACLHVSLTHHIGMATLVQAGAIASGFALLRPQIEAHVRGLWLQKVASDDEMERVKNGDNPPSTPKLASLLEQDGTFDAESLTKIAEGVWPAVCDFTHTGIRVIYAHLRAGAIQPSFSDQEVEDVFQISNIWAALAGIALFEMAGKSDLATELGQRGVELAQQKAPSK